MRIEEAVKIKPSQRQFAWQKLEFYGFVHFGMNTMTSQEWGDGTDLPEKFNPTALDCRQWIKALKSAGMRGAILTCKHHDGFCLWPSQYTDYSVKSSPWKAGQGDIVREFSEACQAEELKFGIYLSPWDRHEESYGQGKAYDDYYIQQLTELLTNYGEVFEVWLDGACGEGKTGRKQVYDWQRYYDKVRELQPQAVIAVCGPDIRWIGNEAGKSRANEWSVVPQSLQDAEKIAADSQQSDDEEFSTKITSLDEELGTRKIIESTQENLVWYPAEVDTSIRPGWFYHQEEDSQVKSLQQLWQIYLSSVGGNASFLLNVPPRPDGLLAEEDRQVLAKLGHKIAQLKENRVLAELSFSSLKNEVEPEKLQNQVSAFETVYQPTLDDPKPTITMTFSQPQMLDSLVLQEDIRQSQRIEAGSLWGESEGHWDKLAEFGTVGYKKILTFTAKRFTRLRLELTDFREFPTLSCLSAVYLGEEGEEGKDGENNEADN